MSKQDRSNDGFYSKIIVAAIVVIWVSLVGGNWLGHYVVEKHLLGKTTRQEYRASVEQKPKPWITVDPAQQQELERLQGHSAAVFDNPRTTPTPEASASATPEEPPITASPIEEEAPAPAVTPLSTPVSADPPLPTPTEVAAATYQLQFGSFESEENAQRLVDSLSAVGQDAQLEEVDGADGKKRYRVRGGAYTEEEARQRRDKLREQSFQVFISKSQ